MPPSGFSSQQASFIIGFLESCTHDLINEGHAEDKSPVMSLHDEIKVIQGLTGTDGEYREGLCTPHLLSMLASYYRALASRKPSNYEELRNIAEQDLLPSTQAEIEQLKAPASSRN